MEYVLCLKEKYYEEIAGDNIGEVSKEVLHLFKASEDYQSYNRPYSFFIGKDGDIKITGTEVFFHVSGRKIEIIGEPEKELIYLNKRRFMEKTFNIIRGDCLLAGECRIVFQNGFIKIYSDSTKYKCSLMPVEKAQVPFEGFPEYKRSPRIIKRVPKDTIEIKSPPENAKIDKNGLIVTVMLPLTSSAVTVGVGLLIGRGNYLLMSIGITFVTVIFSIIRFFKDRKDRKETDKKNAALYTQYLLDKRKEIYHQYIKEKEAYDYNYPDTVQIAKIINSYSDRIYERLPSDKDFLNITLGRYQDEISFRVDLREKGITSDINELYEEARLLKKEYSIIEKEMIFDLKSSQLGLVGNSLFIHEQLKSYICQLAVFQSYRDLQIIAIYDEKQQASFNWMKWLPHCKLQMLNVYGMVYSDRTRDQVLNSINQILKERFQKLEESKKETRYLPQFLFIIDEPRFIMDHSIMEYLSNNWESLGCSVIYTSYLRGNLPEHVNNVLILDHAREGTLLLKYGEYLNKKININANGKINFELCARNLGTLNHVSGSTSHIPESITFFNLYNILKPDELNIEKRWKNNKSEKTLAVPLGMRAVDDIVELNLHEKVHGPHGLVAGTTGSGKSELIQSYILSLAVNFSPYEVGFLLIDYKGGGMSGLFKKLPHLLGTITNLDGSESMRALASIKSELARRQRVFGENNVNHINSYMSLFRECIVKEPIPHLFLISDEFAELKKEQPEFMKELVSTARIGRSLGVHLILATQKPSGVVDDQIWSNSKFKLALKVQNESDSKEILKTPDAASITQPGRAYLQVGNNEIYELFQSAWSGAPYYEQDEREVTGDNRVYELNSLGQGVLINKDLDFSDMEKKSMSTQLDITVDYISEFYKEFKKRFNNTVTDVAKPWLPALKPKISSPVLKDKEHLSDYRNEGISIPVGMIDIPEMQLQKTYMVNITNEGNLMYIASGGFGKSVFLTTVALSMALKYRVSEVNFFILDFGNNALISLSDLPHTAEYISLDNVEHYNRFKSLMSDEIKNRKKIMAKEFAQNVNIYNQTVDTPFTSWVVLVDNFDAVKEMGFEEEEFFTKLSRDGISLGIYIIMTATRVNAIRSATYNNFKNRIAGFNFEKGEILYIVGRSQYTIPEIKGRCLVKYDERVCVMQLFAMADFNNDIEYRSKIKELILQIKEKNTGDEAAHMPMMPEEITLSTMDAFSNPDIDLYVGIEINNIFKDGFCMAESPIIILGNPGSGKTNLLKLFIHQLKDNAKITLFDSESKELKLYEGGNIEYIKDINEFISFMNRLEAEVLNREKLTAMSNGDSSESEVKFEKRVILIDNLTSFYSHKTTSKAEIADVLQRAANTGIFIAATNLLSKFYSGEPVMDLFKNSAKGVLLSNQSYMGIAPVDLVPGVNEGVIYKRGYASIVRIPKV